MSTLTSGASFVMVALPPNGMGTALPAVPAACAIAPPERSTRAPARLARRLRSELTFFHGPSRRLAMPPAPRAPADNSKRPVLQATARRRIRERNPRRCSRPRKFSRELLSPCVGERNPRQFVPPWQPHRADSRSKSRRLANAHARRRGAMVLGALACGRDLEDVIVGDERDEAAPVESRRYSQIRAGRAARP